LEAEAAKMAESSLPDGGSVTGSERFCAFLLK
jgi:hypothetical protein